MTLSLQSWFSQLELSYKLFPISKWQCWNAIEIALKCSYFLIKFGKAIYFMQLYSAIFSTLPIAYQWVVRPCDFTLIIFLLIDGGMCSFIGLIDTSKICTGSPVFIFLAHENILSILYNFVENVTKRRKLSKRLHFLHSFLIWLITLFY